MIRPVGTIFEFEDEDETTGIVSIIRFQVAGHVKTYKGIMERLEPVCIWPCEFLAASGS